MRKLPWGIFMGICAMFVFFLTVGLIALYLGLNGIADQTSETVSFFEYWYQTLMFVFDIIFVLGFAGCLTMYILRIKGEKTEEVAEA